MTCFLSCRDLGVFKVFFDHARDGADLEEMAGAGTLAVDAVAGVLVHHHGADDPRIVWLHDLVDPRADAADTEPAGVRFRDRWIPVHPVIDHRQVVRRQEAAMRDDEERQNEERPNEERPNEDGRDDASVRQLLHSATGDRDAEAAVVADDADDADDDVTEEAARHAVRVAHGDVHDAEVGDLGGESDHAGPDDAAAVEQAHGGDD